MTDRLTRWEGADENGPRAVLIKRDGPFHAILQEALRKLAAYEDTGLAPKEVRCFLPCAIGDAVWGIRNHKGHRCAHHGFVSEMYYSQDMKLIIVVKNTCRGEFGKTVFLTREAAEAALKGEST